MPFGSDIIGNLLRGKPTMPGFKPVTPDQAQTDTVRDNLAILPQAEDLAGKLNIFNQDQLRRMLETSIPGYEDTKGKIGGILSDELAGKVPLSDQQQLSLRDTAKSFGGGYAGSGAAGNLSARDLGLTELSLVETGLSSTENWMKTVNSLENPGQFNVASMFLSPGQVMAQKTEERNAEFQHDWARNLIDWQTSTGYAAANDLESSVSMVLSAVGGMAGSGAGGGGGGGGYT